MAYLNVLALIAILGGDFINTCNGKSKWTDEYDYIIGKLYFLKYHMLFPKSCKIQ